MAAVFLNKGRDVLTAKEFVMYVSLDLRWMPVKDAYSLITALSERKMMEVTGEYVKPSIDLSGINVPVAYRPSGDLISALDSQKKNGNNAPVNTEGSFPKLIGIAVKNGTEKGKFVSECNKISKSLNVDMEIAALLTLREMKIDITPYVKEVSEEILGR